MLVPENADVSALSAPFDYHSSLRVVYGVGAIDRMGELATEIGMRSPLLVTDPGIREAGHADRAASSLIHAGLEVTIFDGVHENPTTRHVADCVAAARRSNADSLIAVGGGSSMDAAKGANFILTNGGRMQDYWGVGKATKPMLPMIAVPTTAGTGSEAQSFALIADENTHQKMACGDKKAMCRIAVLDPAVTLSQPRQVTAVVGIDAIAHAVESFVCRKRTAISRVHSAAAWRFLSSHFESVLHNPDDLEHRGAMLLGAHLAGRAIELSMLGAAHSAANPLTTHFGITHGIAVGIMLPWVVTFNSQVCGSDYGELVGNSDSPGERLSALLTEFLIEARIPTKLRDCGVEESLLDKLAEEAAAQWTANFNPRPIVAEDFAKLYRQAY